MSAVETTIIAPPKKGWLNPTNRRRLENFKANRRGFWSFWIFMVLFVLSLFAEFIANDKPVIASYKGEILFPVIVDYPEEKFGGFLAVTDYRSPFISDEINANGWMVWPPIRYSYRTVNSEVPHSAPTAPFWLMDKETRCAAYPLGAEDPNCVLGNMNWLGLDDQGRDVMARIIYGFRVSVIFGLLLTILSSIIGVAAGAVLGSLFLNGGSWFLRDQWRLLPSAIGVLVVLLALLLATGIVLRPFIAAGLLAAVFAMSTWPL